MHVWQQLRRLLSYLAPESSLVSPRKHIAVVTVLLAVAAIAGAVVLTPSHRSKPDVLEMLRERVSERAQVDLFDDFSHGLDDWQSGENLASTWSYDKSGFINLGSLSLFEPSMQLTNYDLDALVQIEARGVGLVFRAASPQNYHVAKLLVDGPSAMPLLAVERYAVMAGRRSQSVITQYPKRFQGDTLYRVHLQVRDNAFTLYIQGNLIAYWSEESQSVGGVGLFCSPGEHARVAWVRVTHNADSLGRVCSLLSSVL
jgi:hypothetical protein